MKKSFVAILAVSLVIAGVLTMGCASTGGSSSSSSSAAAAAPAADSGNLGAFRARMEDNFQYGNTYNALIVNRAMLGGYQIQAGETWTLKVTYSASRDMEDKMQIGFVDTTEKANWWTQLTWDDDKGIENAQIPASKAGEAVSATITLKTIAAASGTSAQANALVFMTEGEGVTGRAGGGAQKPFNLEFTEFVLTKE